MEEWEEIGSPGETPFVEYHVSGSRDYSVNGIFARISAARSVYRRIVENNNIYNLFKNNGIWTIAMVDSGGSIRKILYEKREYWTSIEGEEEEELMRVICKPSGSWYEGRNWNPPEWLLGEVDFIDSDELWNYGVVRHIDTENLKVEIETMHSEKKTEYVNFIDCSMPGSRAFSAENPNLSKNQKVLVLVEDEWRKAKVVGKSKDYVDKWEFELLTHGPYGIDGIFLNERSGKIGIL